MPDWKKSIAGKMAIAKQGNKAGKVNERVPTGGKRVTNCPVLDLGVKPAVPVEKWPLNIDGLVEKELLLDWKGTKWLKAIALHEHDKPGFWEGRGYHNEAFPFQEQRLAGGDER